MGLTDGRVRPSGSPRPQVTRAECWWAEARLGDSRRAGAINSDQAFERLDARARTTRPRVEDVADEVVRQVEDSGWGGEGRASGWAVPRSGLGNVGDVP
ncbi:hypothetical protein [Ornithinimicrobium kibberense]|uniref:hypothetical protein n=1 Tax=Ornithinimicrobium kibberense TaxID=282060 RepID=UPI003621491A